MKAENKIGQAKAAAITFIDSLDVLDRAAVISFSSRVTFNQAFTGDKSVLRSTVNRLQAGGGTAAYDAIYEGIRQTSKEIGVKAVIAFTDGLDNKSRRAIPRVVELANSTGIPVYTIGLGSDVDAAGLNNIAKNTGAYYAFAPRASDLAKIYNEISEAIRNQYLVTYKTHNPNFDGLLRTVTVTVTTDLGSDADAGTYRVDEPPRIVRTNETIQLGFTAQLENQNYTISAIITDNIQVTAANLFYRLSGSGESYRQLPMTKVGGDLYSATIPAFDALHPGIDYYITASDGALTSSDPITDPTTSPYQFAIYPNEKPVIVHEPVTSTLSNSDIEISAEIEDITDRVEVAKVFYRPTGDILFESVDMLLLAGNRFRTAIPANAVTLAGVEYYILAADNYGLYTTHGSDTAPHQITVVEGGIISGLVVSADEKSPIKNAQIEVYRVHAGQRGDLEKTLSSGDDGTYSTKLPPGEYILVVRRGGFEEIESSIITTQAGDIITVPTLELPPSNLFAEKQTVSNELSAYKGYVDEELSIQELLNELKAANELGNLTEEDLKALEALIYAEMLIRDARIEAGALSELTAEGAAQALSITLSGISALIPVRTSLRKIGTDWLAKLAFKTVNKLQDQLIELTSDLVSILIEHSNWKEENKTAAEALSTGIKAALELGTEEISKSGAALAGGEIVALVMEEVGDKVVIKFYEDDTDDLIIRTKELAEARKAAADAKAVFLQVDTALKDASMQARETVEIVLTGAEIGNAISDILGLGAAAAAATGIGAQVAVIIKVTSLVLKGASLGVTLGGTAKSGYHALVVLPNQTETGVLQIFGEGPSLVMAASTRAKPQEFNLQQAEKVTAVTAAYNTLLQTILDQIQAGQLSEAELIKLADAIGDDLFKVDTQLVIETKSARALIFAAASQAGKTVSEGGIANFESMYNNFIDQYLQAPKDRMALYIKLLEFMVEPNNAAKRDVAFAQGTVVIQTNKGLAEQIAEMTTTVKDIKVQPGYLLLTSTLNELRVTSYELRVEGRLGGGACLRHCRQAALSIAFG